MKKYILGAFLMTATIQAQTAVFDKITEGGSYESYQTESGQIIKVGDTIRIGYPQGREYMYILQGDLHAGTILTNRKVVIKKIKTGGNEKRGYKAYAIFGGYGLSPVQIDIEAAIATKEILWPK